MVDSEDRVGQGRRRQLVDTAIDVMAAAEWRSVTVDDVPAGGLNKRYFYESFADLDELAEATVDFVARGACKAVSIADAPVRGSPRGMRAHESQRVGTGDLAATAQARVLYGPVSASAAVSGHRASIVRATTQQFVDVAREVYGAIPEPTGSRTASAFVSGGTGEAILQWLDDHPDDDPSPLIDDTRRIVGGHRGRLGRGSQAAAPCQWVVTEGTVPRNIGRAEGAWWLHIDVHAPVRRGRSAGSRWRSASVSRWSRGLRSLPEPAGESGCGSTSASSSSSDASTDSTTNDASTPSEPSSRQSPQRRAMKTKASANEEPAADTSKKRRDATRDRRRHRKRRVLQRSSPTPLTRSDNSDNSDKRSDNSDEEASDKDASDTKVDDEEVVTSAATTASVTVAPAVQPVVSAEEPPQDPAEVVTTALTTVVSAVLDPFAGDAPTAPAESPLSWMMLAAARREFLGQAPTVNESANPVATDSVAALVAFEVTPQPPVAVVQTPSSRLRRVPVIGPVFVTPIVALLHQIR